MLKQILKYLLTFCTPDEPIPVPKPRVEVVFVARIQDAVFQDFKKKVNNGIYVSHQTTEIQAGHMLGVQHVLNLLQENLTIPNS